VNGVVGRADLLCALLMLAASALYAPASRGTSVGWGRLLASVALCFCGYWCKETGITTLALLAFHDLRVLLLPTPASDASTTTLEPAQQAKRATFTRLLVLAASVVAFLTVRKLVLVDMNLLGWRYLDAPIKFQPTWSSRVLSFAYLHARYFWLLVWPVTLSADYSATVIMPIEDLADPRNALTVRPLPHTRLFALVLTCCHSSYSTGPSPRRFCSAGISEAAGCWLALRGEQISSALSVLS
jgi:hypothetical protein